MNPQDPDKPVSPEAAADSAGATAPQDAVLTVEKRRRAPRKKSTGAGTEGPQVEAAAVSEARVDFVPAASVEAAALSTTTAVGPATQGEAAIQESGSELQLANLAGASAIGAGTQGREGPRRSRNRRRGRRGGDAASTSIDDAAPDTSEAATAEVRVHLPQPEVGEVFANLLSGAFDAEPAVVDAEVSALAPTKRVLAAEPDAPKLQKVLAQAGIGSRRDMEQLVAGRSHHRQRRARACRPAHLLRRPATHRRQGHQGAHCATAAARAGLSQAGRRGSYPRRPATPAHGIPAPATAAPGQVAVGRAAGHEHRGPVAVHQFRRTRQPADASAFRHRARVRGARARRGR